MLWVKASTLQKVQYYVSIQYLWNMWNPCSRILRSFTKPKLHKTIWWKCPLNTCCVLFAAAEWKSPAAWLKPGFPQNLVPRHLALNAVCVSVGVWMSVIRRLHLREGASMSLRSFGSLLQDFSVSRLGIRGQRAGLGGVAEEVVQQRRVVVRHVLSMTQTDLGVIAPASSRGRKVGSEKVHLEDRVTWMETHT